MRFTIVVAAALMLVACSSDSKTSTSSSSSSSSSAAATTTTAASLDDPAAKAEITAAYTTFFDGKNTDTSTKTALLEDYDKIKDLYAQGAAANAALLSQTSATVTKVTLTSPTTADVTFTILLNDQPALPDFAGKAVKVDGKWLVAKATFCDISYIGQAQPAACTS